MLTAKPLPAETIICDLDMRAHAKRAAACTVETWTMSARDGAAPRLRAYDGYDAARIAAGDA